METVVDGVTGILFDEQTLESLDQALIACESSLWDREQISTHAQKFSKENFQRNILSFLDSLV